MIKKLFKTLIIIGLVGPIYSQALQPSIGLSSLPADSDPVCAITTYTGSFNTSGYQEGDTIPQFQLYDINGVAADALTLLQTGKPLLLIAGSYTCPVYRGKIAAIESIAATFAGLINIYVVYVVEAHPNTPDVSPYSGTVWTTSENQSEGILYLQPTTYGEKKSILSDELADTAYPMTVPVLIDGPCNEWWLNFGPAPNNAYLINPDDGVVFAKHAWFNQAPENMTNDINALLAILSVEEAEQYMPTIYPNPAHSFVNIQLPTPQTITSITIYDAIGKEVYKNSSPITENVYQINTENYSKGMYTCVINNNQFTTTRKIIIE